MPPGVNNVNSLFYSSFDISLQFRNFQVSSDYSIGRFTFFIGARESLHKQRTTNPHLSLSISETRLLERVPLSSMTRLSIVQTGLI